MPHEKNIFKRDLSSNTENQIAVGEIGQFTDIASHNKHVTIVYFKFIVISVK